MVWSGLTRLEIVRNWVDDAGPPSDVWYYVRVEVAAQSLDLENMLSKLGPNLSLRATGDEKYIVEGHAGLDELSTAIQDVKNTLRSANVDAGVLLSVTVEPHDYERLDLPTLYLEA